MLTITTWVWGDKYADGDYLEKLRAGVRRHLRQDHRFVAFQEAGLPKIGDIETRPIWFARHLTKEKGCFVRLQMFSRAWQGVMDIEPGERIVLMDLDTVVTGQLDPLFDRPEPFLILRGGNAHNPCPYNGAMQMLRAGAYQEVWSDFTLDKAKAVPFYQFPDDQGWLWHKIPDASGWNVGSETGAYVFRKPGWPGYGGGRLPANEERIATDELPPDARLVTFSGKRSPAVFSDLEWVRRHWAT